MEFYVAGEITQVIDSIPWVRCASGNVLFFSARQKDMKNYSCNESPCSAKVRSDVTIIELFDNSNGKIDSQSYS